MNRLHGQQVKIGYGDNTIINKLDVEIPDGKVTSIIGPNGCGKSTLLKALSRLLAVKEGEVFLDGENIHTQSTKGCTIVMVLHDINQAIRFSDHLIAMKEGDIIATGSTEDVLTQEILEKVFNIDVVLSKDPKTGKPLLVTYDLCRRAYS